MAEVLFCTVNTLERKDIPLRRHARWLIDDARGTIDPGAYRHSDGYRHLKPLPQTGETDT